MDVTVPSIEACTGAPSAGLPFALRRAAEHLSFAYAIADGDQPARTARRCAA